MCRLPSSGAHKRRSFVARKIRRGPTLPDSLHGGRPAAPPHAGLQDQRVLQRGRLASPPADADAGGQAAHVHRASPRLLKGARSFQKLITAVPSGFQAFRADALEAQTLPLPTSAISPEYSNHYARGGRK